MKKLLYLIPVVLVILLIIFLNPKTTKPNLEFNNNKGNKPNIENNNTIKYEEAQKAIKEVMKQYYIKGPYFQYNYAKATYGAESPEDATSQDTKYAVCGAFTYDIYAETFGMKSGFPSDNSKIMEAASNSLGKNQGGKLLIYYQKNNIVDGKVTTPAARKFLYQNKYKFSEFVEIVEPGDLFVYSGHALIAYDTTINPKTNQKDVLILHSTADYYIRTRIENSSDLSYNFLNHHNYKNNILDNDSEGSLQWIWLSELEQFVDENGNINCSKKECAVIRPFYKDDNNNAVFNYEINEEQYKKSELRTQYPGLFIEKTVKVGDNNGVYLGDTLTYTIKVVNKSNVSGKGTTYKSFKIEEQISEYVQYQSSTKSGKKSGDTITWTINSLKAGSSIELTYTVKIINKTSYIGKTIKSIGKFYNTKSNSTSISTGTVGNKIIAKRGKSYEDKYLTCYNKYKNKLSGLDLIDQIYVCATGQNFKFSSTNTNIFSLSGTTKQKAAIKFKSSLNSNQNNIKNMILNNYFSGLTTDSSGKYLLPRWGTNSQTRAKTINPKDFKDGDVLIYNITNSTKTNESGIYAYIYIDGKFVGVNGSGKTSRNEFTHDYYASARNASKTTCNKYNYEPGTECNYYYYLYGGYNKLNSLSKTKKEEILEFVNYQTLFDKDYYMILRPEIVMK